MTKYRKEIDGLRAVAVLPVIFYHAGFPFFSGGYVGVDIFFVISGYLITSIIIQDLKLKTFSLMSFYERRMRRIIPALFFIIIFSLFFILLWASNKEVINYAESAFAAATFWSNILFWNEQSNYFSESIDLIPLIHTWSLSIEEQFYIFFPILLIILWKFGQKIIFLAVFFLIICSLLWAEYSSNYYPTSSFYLIFSRIWEILIGSLIAILISKKKQNINFNNFVNQLLSLLGAILIVYSILKFDSLTRTPSLFTLIPIVGAGLIILFSVNGTILNSILSSRLISQVGLISYSTYLWHHIIFVIARFRSLDEISSLFMISLIFLSFILGYLTWKFIEKPFRNKEIISSNNFFYLVISGLFLIISFHFYAKTKIIDLELNEVMINQTKYKFPVTYGGITQNDLICNSIFYNYSPKIKDCIIRKNNHNPNSIFIIGDSHARVLSESFLNEENIYGELSVSTESNCPLIVNSRDDNFYVSEDEKRCSNKFQKLRLNYVRDYNKKNKILILSANWPTYFFQKGFDNTIGGKEIDSGLKSNFNFEKNKAELFLLFEETIESLNDKVDKIFIVLPTHSNGWNVVKRSQKIKRVKKIKTTSEMEKLLEIPIEIVDKRVLFIDKFFYSLAKKNGKIEIVDPKKYTCDREKKKCYGFRDDYFLFSDADHLSLYINNKIKNEITKKINSEL